MTTPAAASTLRCKLTIAETQPRTPAAPTVRAQLSAFTAVVFGIRAAFHLQLILTFAAVGLGSLLFGGTAGAQPVGDAWTEGLRDFRDLAPYFQGNLGKLGKLVKKNKCRPALAEVQKLMQRRELRDAVRGQVAFVAGLCAKRLHQHAKAVGYFAEASERYRPLKDQALFHLGDSLLRIGEPERAAEALGRVQPDSPRFEQARSLWARALDKTVEPAQLSAALLRFVAAHPLDPAGLPPLPQVGPPPRRQTGGMSAVKGRVGPESRTVFRRGEISLRLARALDNAGSESQSLQHYLYTWARFPGSSASKRAGERLAELRETHGKAAQPDVYYRFLHGRSLIAAGNAKGARRILAPLLNEAKKNGPAELRWPTELALGVALARSGDGTAATHRFRAIAESATDVELRGEAAYRAAEVLARRRKVDRAVKLYRQVGDRHAGTKAAPLALLDGGELARLYGRHRDAKAAFQKLVDEYPAHQRAARGHWRLGWYAYRASKHDAARDHFHAAVGVAHRGDEEMRSLYWLGRAEGKLQRPARAAAAYRTLRRNYPLSYYGHLAHRRIASLPKDLDSTAEETLIAPLVGDGERPALQTLADPRLLLARELIRLGLSNDAHTALKRYEHGVSKTDAGMLAVASLYQELGLSRRAHWVLRLRAYAYRRSAHAPELRAFWLQAYPRKFTQEIDRAASRARVPAPLLLGLVREESTFEPRAISPQRAMGLTQVIWETATDMARQLKIRLRGKRDCFNPRINATLGARFLANLIKTYRGKKLLAIAAYNAGPGNVDRWLSQRGLHRDGPVPEDEIVEDIPFEETRHYVRKVFGSYAAYASLYYGERLASAPAEATAGTMALYLP